MIDPKAKALAEIQRRREKLSRMEAFLQSLDSEDLMWLRQVLVDQDDGIPEQIQVIENVADAPRTEKSTRPQAPHGALEIAVQSAISDMDIITVPAIVQKLIASGYVFSAQSPLAAVNQVIRKFRENGILIEVEPGSGRRATKYRKASTSGDADGQANFRLAS